METKQKILDKTVFLLELERNMVLRAMEEYALTMAWEAFMEGVHFMEESQPRNTNLIDKNSEDYKKCFEKWYKKYLNGETQ